jgi:acetoin utilization protein AcuA
MSKVSSKEILLQTPKGAVLIRSFCTPEEIHRCTFDTEFRIYPHYRSLYTKRKSLEKLAVQPGANVVLAVIDHCHIIGFGVLAYPDTGERWIALGPRMMMEIKAIEVVRSRRSAGIAHGLMRMILSHPQIEDKIIYMVGYSWTWDLEGAQKTAQEYRRMLVELFGPYGFREFQTNEPNICLKPENIFMGRIGKNISQDLQTQFKWLRFGIAPIRL